MIIGGEDAVGVIYGFDPDDIPVLLELEEGTFLRGSSSAMVGARFAELNDIKVGSRISVGDKGALRVVGILKERGMGFDINPDYGIVVDSRWFEQSYTPDGYDLVIVKVRNLNQINDVKAAITAGYSLWGSSAGARMAATIGSHGAARYGGGDVPRPSAVVMAYTGHSDHSSAEPPTFVVVGEQDGIAPPAAVKRRVKALRRAGAVVEFHEYEGLGHGFGLGTGTSAEGWVFDAVRFWETSLSRGSSKPGR